MAGVEQRGSQYWEQLAFLRVFHPPTQHPTTAATAVSRVAAPEEGEVRGSEVTLALCELRLLSRWGCRILNWCSQIRGYI